jgi:hypothetical protein
VFDPDTTTILYAAAGELLSAGDRLPNDISVGDFDLLMAVTNRMGKVVAMMREALETVPEDQRR